VSQGATAAFEGGVDAWLGICRTIPNEERN